jgi:hypothetical protein
MQPALLHHPAEQASISSRKKSLPQDEAQRPPPRNCHFPYRNLKIPVRKFILSARKLAQPTGQMLG